MSTIGTIGAKLDLLVRQGMTFGPHRVSCVDPVTKAPLTILAGGVVSGQVRKLLPVEGPTNNPNSDLFVVDLDIQQPLSSGLLGHQYTFGLTAIKTDSVKPGSSLKDPVGQYQYDLQVTYGDGTVRPLTHGKLTVYREVTRP